MLLNNTNSRQNINVNNLFSNPAQQRGRNIPRTVSELFPSRTRAANNANTNNTQNNADNTQRAAASNQSNRSVYGVGSSNTRIGQIVRQSVNLNAFQNMNRINMNRTVSQEQTQSVNRNVQQEGRGNPIARNRFNTENLENTRTAQPQLNLNVDIPRVTEERRNESLFEPNINRSRRYGAVRNQDFTNLNFRINNARERIRGVRNTISNNPQAERRTVTNIARRNVNQPNETAANRTNENSSNNNTRDFETLLNTGNRGRRIDLFT